MTGATMSYHRADAPAGPSAVLPTSRVAGRSSSPAPLSRATEAYAYALFVVLGVGSWITINGIYLELPLLVGTAPEGWALATYLAVVTQLGNLGPLAYAFVDGRLRARHVAARRAARQQRRQRQQQPQQQQRQQQHGGGGGGGGEQWLTEEEEAEKEEEEEEGASPGIPTGVGVCVLVGVNTVAMALLAGGAWRTTAVVGGAPRSVALLGLAFVAALADCTSSLVFWPFVAGCKPIFVSALAVGEASTAVVAAAIALVQGQARAAAAAAADSEGEGEGGNDGLLFGPSVYFGVLAGIMGLTGVSYVLITALPREVRLDMGAARRRDEARRLGRLERAVRRASMVWQQQKGGGVAAEEGDGVTAAGAAAVAGDGDDEAAENGGTPTTPTIPTTLTATAAAGSSISSSRSTTTSSASTSASTSSGSSSSGGSSSGGSSSSSSSGAPWSSVASASAHLAADDRTLLDAVASAGLSFVVTDPGAPDNPIVYASPGFRGLTGYAPGEVVGRNCNFLQGPGTDARAVGVIRAAIEAGDACCHVCLLNYRKDGAVFYNQFFIAPLRRRRPPGNLTAGPVEHFIGVQCPVTREQFEHFQATQFGGGFAGGQRQSPETLRRILLQEHAGPRRQPPQQPQQQEQHGGLGLGGSGLFGLAMEVDEEGASGDDSEEGAKSSRKSSRSRSSIRSSTSSSSSSSSSSPLSPLTPKRRTQRGIPRVGSSLGAETSALLVRTDSPNAPVMSPSAACLLTHD
jgi:PAS domain S-box-containing protein